MKFDLNKDKNRKADKDKNADEQHDKTIARQSGHTVETAGAAYTRLLNEALSYIQQMRYRFQVSSVEWHKVLEFSLQLAEAESTGDSQLKRGLESRLGGDLKREQEEEHERSSEPQFRRWQGLQQTNLQEAL